MDPIEEAIENSDNLVVNYNMPKYSAKEQLVATSIGAGVGLVAVGIIIGTGKLIEVASTAAYNHGQRRKAKKLAKEAKKDLDQD